MSTARLTLLLAIPALAIIPAQSPAQPAAPEGERLFRTRCGSCHSIQAGQNRVGPHLAKVVGRKAGSVEGAHYSQGMKASGFVWDAQKLDSYLANPRQMVAGTTMPVSVNDPAQRAAIVAYLNGASGAN